MRKMQVFAVVFSLLLILIQPSHNQATRAARPLKCPLKDFSCMTTQAQKTLKEFIIGIPRLGIPKVDKIYIDDIVVNTDQFSFNWTDIKVEGLENSIFDNISINMDFKTMQLTLHSNINLYFDYAAQGSLLSIIDVYGIGKGEVLLGLMQMDLLFVFDIVKDDRGKDVMDFKSYFFAFMPFGKARFHFYNLYDGDKKRSDIYHNVLDENWRIIVAKFGGFIHEKIAAKVFELVKIFMRSHPLEDLIFLE